MFSLKDQDEARQISQHFYGHERCMRYVQEKNDSKTIYLVYDVKCVKICK
jgi:hypothetical protein